MSKDEKVQVKFVPKKHLEYILNLDKDEEEDFQFFVTEHLR